MLDKLCIIIIIFWILFAIACFFISKEHAVMTGMFLVCLSIAIIWMKLDDPLY